MQLTCHSHGWLERDRGEGGGGGMARLTCCSLLGWSLTGDVRRCNYQLTASSSYYFYQEFHNTNFATKIIKQYE